MELADKMSFPSMAVTVDVNVVFFSSIATKKKKKSSTTYRVLEVKMNMSGRSSSPVIREGERYCGRST